MVHVANPMAACRAMIDIMCIMAGDAGVLGYIMCSMTSSACMFGYIVGLMTCGASVFGDVVCIMTGRPGVSAWAVIARRATVFRHATMIVAAIMPAGRGTSRVSVAAVITVAGGATTMASVGTVIATGVASRGSGTATTAIAVPTPSGAISATTAATIPAATTTTATVATATTMISHGTLDLPSMRSAIEPPGSRGHRQSTCAYRQCKQQRTPTSVGA